MIIKLVSLYEKIIGTHQYGVLFLSLHRKLHGEMDINISTLMTDRRTANEDVKDFFNSLESGYFWETVNGYSRKAMLWTGDIPEECDTWGYTFSDLIKIHMDLEWQFINQPRHETEDVSILQGLIGSALHEILSICSWRVRRQFYKVVEDSEDLFSGIDETYLHNCHVISMDNYYHVTL